MSIWYVLIGGLLPWLLLFAGTVYLIRLWKEPGPRELERAEVEDLREQVSLMRDFMRDAMERIARLEEARGGGSGVEGGRSEPSLPRPEAPEPGPDGP